MDDALLSASGLRSMRWAFSNVVSFRSCAFSVIDWDYSIGRMAVLHAELRPDFGHTGPVGAYFQDRISDED